MSQRSKDFNVALESFKKAASKRSLVSVFLIVSRTYFHVYRNCIFACKEPHVRYTHTFISGVQFAVPSEAMTTWKLEWNNETTNKFIVVTSCTLLYGLESIFGAWNEVWTAYLKAIRICEQHFDEPHYPSQTWCEDRGRSMCGEGLPCHAAFFSTFAVSLLEDKTKRWEKSEGLASQRTLVSTPKIQEVSETQISARKQKIWNWKIRCARKHQNICRKGLKEKFCRA